MAICESRVTPMVATNEKSPNFSQLLLFYAEKQHDSWLIEGSKNGSLE